MKGCFKKRVLTGFCLLIVAAFSFAQSFHVQITPEAGFDTVDSIYNEFQQQQPQSELTILNQYQPIEIDYLIASRPTGNLLDLMIQNPDWSAAQLARILVIKFAYPVDVTAVMDNFQTHESVEYASYDFALNPYEFNPVIPNHSNNTVLNLAFLAGNCEDPWTNPQGLSHNITVNGSVIDLDVVVLFHFPVQPVICATDNPQVIPYDLGVLNPGNYTLNIYNVYQQTEFPAADNERYYMGQINFSVMGAATQVPALNIISILLMTLTLLGFTWFHAQRK